jgi:uncharacterized protein YjbJ (UPF0337 family)
MFSARETNGIENKEPTMIKPSTKDEFGGDLHDLKGAVKEKAGKLMNDPDLEAEGQTEKIGGKIQKIVGKVEKVLGQ